MRVEREREEAAGLAAATARLAREETAGREKVETREAMLFLRTVECGYERERRWRSLGGIEEGREGIESAGRE